MKQANASSIGYSAPLVDGTPCTRGSRATASRSARATALNWASTTWWALRPVQHAHVQADLRRGADRLPDVPGQRRVVRADQLDDLRLAVHDVGAAGQVDGGLHEGLVERHQRVAEAADARLVAEGLAQRLARAASAVSSTVWCASTSRSPTRAHREVEAAVLAELGEHVVEERHAGVDVGRRRVPSRSSSTRTSDSLVVRSTRAVRVMPGSPQAVATRAVRKAWFSSGVPTLTRSHPSGPVSRISTPRSSSPRQTACRSAKRPNSTKLASVSATVEALAPQPGDQVVALGAQQVDPGQQLVGVRPGRRGRRPG